MFRTKRFVLPAALGIVVGCSYLTACGEDPPEPGTFSPEEGGSTGNGGASTGGTKATGGRSATGGRVGSGGRSGTGGSQTGGSQSTGGASTGGVRNTGGVQSTGGASTGGASTGGIQSTGGASTGGVQNTGGASTGGVRNTGGASTGGVQNAGGTQNTGGANTGGTGPDASAGGAGGNPEGGLCGNDMLDPGEECDPPSAKFCTAACKLGGTCTECENANNCATLVTDCTQGANADLCVAALQCSRVNDCYRVDPAKCYCGTVDFVACQSGTTPPNGPCIDEYMAAATPNASPAVLLGDLSNASTPLGRAGFIQTCDVAFCNPSNGNHDCWDQ